MQSGHRVTIDTPIQFYDDLPDKVEIVVIGGGVVGVFTTLFLARMGKRVLLCEKGRVAGEQSSRNWGWIRQHGRDFAELPIMMDALRLWHETNAATNGLCGVTTAGSFYLASTRDSLDEYAEWVETARGMGLDSRMYSAGELTEAGLATPAKQWIGATGTPSDARGEPWRVVPAVARLASEAGAMIRENCAVRGLGIEAGKVSGVVTEAGKVACEQVVLAGGAWSSLFARRHGINMPQLLVKGTVAQTNPLAEIASGNYCDEQVAFRRRDDGGYSLAVADYHDFYLGPDTFRHLKNYLPLMWHSWNETDVHSGSPVLYPDGWKTPRSWRDDEQTPFEYCRVLEPTPNDKFLQNMLRLFKSRFPDLEAPKLLQSWAGMIDVMPDIVPIVDRIAEKPGLIIATGMSGHGFGIGPGIGRVVARMVAGEAAEFDLQRFRFSRFTDGSKLELGTSL